ncbi:MAG: hypothetical protein ACLP0B_24270 [Steroidobacteraceae bacterium]|jgi:hypothetical protein
MKKNKLPSEQKGDTGNRSRNIIIGIGLIVATIAAAVLMNRHLIEELHLTHRPQIVFTRPMEIAGPLTCDTADSTASGMETTAQFRCPAVWLKNIGNADAGKVFIGTLNPPEVIRPQLIPLTMTGDPGIDNPIAINDTTCQHIVQDPRYRSFPLYSGNDRQFDSIRQSSLGPQPSLGKDTPVRLVFPWCVGYRDEYQIVHATCATFDFVPAPDSAIEPDSRFFKCGKPIKGSFQVARTGHCES